MKMIKVEFVGNHAFDVVVKNAQIDDFKKQIEEVGAICELK